MEEKFFQTRKSLLYVRVRRWVLRTDELYTF
jgi:hypothetical protein